MKKVGESNLLNLVVFSLLISASASEGALIDCFGLKHYTGDTRHLIFMVD